MYLIKKKKKPRTPWRAGALLAESRVRRHGLLAGGHHHADKRQGARERGADERSRRGPFKWLRGSFRPAVVELVGLAIPVHGAGQADGLAVRVRGGQGKEHNAVGILMCMAAGSLR